MTNKAGTTLWIAANEPFKFRYVLAYFARSKDEVLDVVEDDQHHRVLHVNGRTALLRTHQTCRNGATAIAVETLAGSLPEHIVRQYVERQYQLSSRRDFSEVSDELARTLIASFEGAPTVQAGSPYEALVWAIIGQQINIEFAHRLKRAFVEQFGLRIDHDGRTYFGFPSPEIVANLNHETDLRPLQFSRQKSRYIIALSQAIIEGDLDLDAVTKMDDDEALETLQGQLGVGRWTAEYALLRGFGRQDAIPAGDAGLKAALGVHFDLGRNATEAEVREIAERWRPYRGAIGFLIWLSLQYGWFHKAQRRTPRPPV